LFYGRFEDNGLNIVRGDISSWLDGLTHVKNMPEHVGIKLEIVSSDDVFLLDVEFYEGRGYAVPQKLDYTCYINPTSL